MALRVYGIPTCSTVKKAKKWLEEQGLDYEWNNTRENAPDAETLAGWVGTLGAKPFKNTSGGSYRALGPEKKEWSDEQWIAAFAEDAMLLKRPVLEKDGVALTTGFKIPVWTELLLND